MNFRGTGNRTGAIRGVFSGIQIPRWGVGVVIYPTMRFLKIEEGMCHVPSYNALRSDVQACSFLRGSVQDIFFPHKSHGAVLYTVRSRVCIGDVTHLAAVRFGSSHRWPTLLDCVVDDPRMELAHHRFFSVVDRVNATCKTACFIVYNVFSKAMFGSTIEHTLCVLLSSRYTL